MVEKFHFYKKFNFIRNKVINSLNKSSFVIVNSNYSKNEFVKMGVMENKLEKINPPPNFVKHVTDNEFLRQFRNKLATEYSKIILFCGRLTEQKGVEYLIRAIPQIKTKNVHLVIAGGGGQLSNLKKLATSLRLNDKITFFGRAGGVELAALYDSSDVLVCPSIVDSKGQTEGLGLVIPEAMESGIPVIATSVGGITDTVKNEINGLLVEQKDPSGIAKAIDRIISDKELKNKLIENSKETVKEFQPRILAEKYLSIFESMLNN